MFLLSFILLPLLPNGSYSEETSTSTVEDTTLVSEEQPSLWDVIVKTCDKAGAGTDAAAYLKVYYEKYHDGETFPLDNSGKNDFERGARDHFKLRFKQRDVINVGLFWWPGFSLNQHWCVDWVILLNSDTETCLEAQFDKWILHYRDPPTYASALYRSSYKDCVGPPTSNRTKSIILRFEDERRAHGA